MDNNKTINNWIKIADYDRKTAKAMYESGRYIYVAFTCQQCIEKLLKALFVKLENDTPPYTHNLNRLSQLTKIEKELNKEQTDCLNFLNAYYIKTRYTEELDKLSKNLDKRKSGQLLKQTEQLATWLKQKIK